MQNATMAAPKRLNATIDEVADHLRLSRRMVQVLQERGLLRPVYFGKLRRFRWKEVLQLERSGVRLG
jgi:excisionase family DNA binding protein